MNRLFFFVCLASSLFMTGCPQSSAPPNADSKTAPEKTETADPRPEDSPDAIAALEELNVRLVADDEGTHHKDVCSRLSHWR